MSYKRNCMHSTTYFTVSRNILQVKFNILNKFNMINQTQIFVEGGQVSDKSKTRDNNTFYSKQKNFIIGYTAHRTCPRCLSRSVHIRRQLATAGGLLWCVTCPRRVTNSLHPPSEHLTNTQLAVHYKAITTFAQQYSSQHSIYILQTLHHYFMTCAKKIHYLHVRLFRNF